MSDNIPVLPDTPRIDTERLAKIEKAQVAVAALTEAGLTSAPADASSPRVIAFVAPVEKNTRFLVTAGKPLTVNDPNSPKGKRMYEREGDVFVEFVSGICVLTPGVNDVEIAWCNAHPEICRDASDPMTEAWLYLKEQQVATASKDAGLPSSIDIEALLRGDARGSKVAHETAQRARERAASVE
jgi:hypothetical protein